jgi:hypothetical protein
MSRYIGKQPVSGNFVKLDAITTSATATYALQSGGSAFTPQSVNQMIVSLNGVIQSPTSAFTLSGSNIVFDSALTSSDVIDFILVLGDVNDIGTPSDNTVATAKIVNNAVTADKLASTLDLSSKTLTIPNNNITKAKTNFVSTSSATGLDIKGDGSANGRLGLLCSAGSHGVKLESPDHSVGQSYTIKLPDNQIAADKFIKIKSITGSGATAVGQAEFADAGGGAFTLLQSTTASSASLVAFNSLITSTYRDYRIICSQIDGSEDADVNMQISNDNGSSYQTSGNYRYKNYGYTNGGANGSGANGHTAANFLPATAEFSEAGQSVSLIIDIFNPLSTSHYFTWAVRGHYNEPSSPTRQGGFYGGGAWINVYNTAYNALKIYPTAGTFSGEISLYGRKV